MNEIRAFVGHSFTEDDLELVRKFSLYFSKISQVNFQFSWEHAEQAEPSQLSAKVMAIMADKNLFIGICTRKEKVVVPSALVPMKFWKNYVSAQESDFIWKTSDWIIQEIGIAVGRGLDIILLMEEGVRKPGGIQGDIEYITFSRDAPEKAYVKILEMIAALIPKSKLPSIQGLMTRSDAGDNIADAQIKNPMGSNALAGSSLDIPQEDWTKLTYELAMYFNYRNGDLDTITRIDNSFRESKLYDEHDNAQSWDSLQEWLKIRFAQGGSLSKLRAFAEKFSDSESAQVNLGRASLYFQDNLGAARAFEAAARLATTSSTRLSSLKSAVHAFSEGNETAEVNRVFELAKKDAQGGKLCTIDLLDLLYEVARSQNNNVAEVAALERLTELEPDRDAYIFSLAFKFGHLQCSDMAIRNYLRTPSERRDAIGWNNLGAEFDSCSMPAKSVSAYKRSEELGETLAVANLAAKLIGAGFTDEADERLSAAMKLDEFHKNISATASNLSEVSQFEDEILKATLAKTDAKSAYLRNFGSALCSLQPENVSGSWQGPDCVLNIQIHGDQFIANGTYTRDVSSLFAILANTPFHPGTDTFSIEYKGRLAGCAIEVEITKSKLGSADDITVLASPTGDTGLIIINADGAKLHVMENPFSSTPRFYDIERISS